MIKVIKIFFQNFYNLIVLNKYAIIKYIYAENIIFFHARQFQEKKYLEKCQYCHFPIKGAFSASFINKTNEYLYIGSLPFTLDIPETNEKYNEEIIVKS